MTWFKSALFFYLEELLGPYNRTKKSIRSDLLKVIKRVTEVDSYTDRECKDKIIKAIRKKSDCCRTVEQETDGEQSGTLAHRISYLISLTEFIFDRFVLVVVY